MELTITATDKLERAKENEKQIEEARSRYRPAATRVSVLLFVLTPLSAISSMSEYPLDAFRDLFVASIRQAARSDGLFKRLKNIIDVVTANVFNCVCLSLFGRDRLLFACQMAPKIMYQQLLLNHTQVQLFLNS